MVAGPRIGHRLLVAGASFFATAWEEMPVGIEGNLDTGMAHLIANVGGGFTLSDQLAREEVSQVAKACARHAGFFCDRLPNLCVEFVRIYEAVAIAGKDEGAVRLPPPQLAPPPIATPVAAIASSSAKVAEGASPEKPAESK